MHTQTESVATTTNKRSIKVLASMHQHRFDQFCVRLKWSLPNTQENSESDQFDDGLSEYTVISEGNDHLGSYRLRSANYGTMIEQCFAAELPKTTEFISLNRSSVIELTRFLSSPVLRLDSRRSVCATLRDSLWDQLSQRPDHQIIAVISIPILKLLTRCKVPSRIFESGVIDNSAVVSILLQKSVPELGSEPIDLVDAAGSA